MSGEGLTWEKIVKANGGEPKAGNRYKCTIQGCETGRKQTILLDCVDEDDVLWRTADDGSELSNAWTVIKWVKVSKRYT